MQKKFNGTFDTDGVSICFHFNRLKHDEENEMHLDPVDGQALDQLAIGLSGGYESSLEEDVSSQEYLFSQEDESDETATSDDDPFESDDSMQVEQMAMGFSGGYDPVYSIQDVDQDEEDEESEGPPKKKSRIAAKSKPKSKSKPKPKKESKPRQAKAKKKTSKEIADEKHKRLVKKGRLPKEKKVQDQPKLYKAKPLCEKNTRFIGLDPGNRDMFTAVDGMDETRHQVWSYSSKEHYHNSLHHIMTHRRWMHKKRDHQATLDTFQGFGPRPPSIQEIESSMPTSKTSSHDEFGFYCEYVFHCDFICLYFCLTMCA